MCIRDRSWECAGNQICIGPARPRHSPRQPRSTRPAAAKRWTWWAWCNRTTPRTDPGRAASGRVNFAAGIKSRVSDREQLGIGAANQWFSQVLASGAFKFRGQELLRNGRRCKRELEKIVSPPIATAILPRSGLSNKSARPARPGCCRGGREWRRIRGRPARLAR